MQRAGFRKSIGSKRAESQTCDEMKQAAFNQRRLFNALNFQYTRENDDT